MFCGAKFGKHWSQIMVLSILFPFPADRQWFLKKSYLECPLETQRKDLYPCLDMFIGGRVAIYWGQHDRCSHEHLWEINFGDGIGMMPKTSPSPPGIVSPCTVNPGRLFVNETGFPFSNINWARFIELEDFLYDIRPSHGNNATFSFFVWQRNKTASNNWNISVDSPCLLPMLILKNTVESVVCLSFKVIHGKKLKIHVRRRLPGRLFLGASLCLLINW